MELWTDDSDVWCLSRWYSSSSFFIFYGQSGGPIELKECPSYPMTGYYTVQNKGWMATRTWEMYLDNVVVPALTGPSVIVVNNLECHVSEASRAKLANYGCILETLPKNTTGTCQPLDVGFMGPL